MDKVFTITQGSLEIPCRLTESQCCSPQRLVLGVHGLAGSSKDPIQTALAEEMSLFCSAVFRFDLPGHGKSPEDCEFTLENARESLLTVARHAKSLYPYVEDLCIFATGFGAYITLLCLEELTQLPGNVKLVIQTPSVKMADTLMAMLNISEDAFRAADTIVFPTARPLKVTYALYQSMKNYNVMVNHDMPILILHAEEDKYISMADILNFRQLNEDAKLVIIEGTGHQFMEEGAWDMVLDLTRDWFEFEQVLLTDWQ